MAIFDWFKCFLRKCANGKKERRAASLDVKEHSRLLSVEAQKNLSDAMYEQVDSLRNALSEAVHRAEEAEAREGKLSRQLDDANARLAAQAIELERLKLRESTAGGERGSARWQLFEQIDACFAFGNQRAVAAAASPRLMVKSGGSEPDAGPSPAAALVA